MSIPRTPSFHTNNLIGREHGAAFARRDTHSIPIQREAELLPQLNAVHVSGVHAFRKHGGRTIPTPL